MLVKRYLYIEADLSQSVWVQNIGTAEENMRQILKSHAYIIESDLYHLHKVSGDTPCTIDKRS